MDDEVTIIIVDFFAFGRNHKAAYVNKSDDYIKNDLWQICNSNLLVSITKYSGRHISTEEFNKLENDTKLEKKS